MIDYLWPGGRIKRHLGRVDIVRRRPYAEPRQPWPRLSLSMSGVTYQLHHSDLGHPPVANGSAESRHVNLVDEVAEG